MALTSGERRDYIDLGIGRPQDILIIHSGVDIDAFDSGPADIAAKKASLGLDPGGQLIGFAGWLLPIKGLEHLVNAMPAVLQQHPAATLVLIGKGDLEQALRQQAERMGLDRRVRFLGWRDDVADIMPLLDVFVLPSLNEGMGRVLVEAMAAGRPVVASRVGGIPDLVRHGETGLLVAPRDEIGLAESISLLLNTPSMAERMGAMGRLRCREFSLAAMIAGLDDLYCSLATDRPTRAQGPDLSMKPAHGSRVQAVDTGKTCLPPG